MHVKSVTSKTGRKIRLPTAREDAAIRAGVVAGRDTYELPDKEFKRLRRVGRPRAAVTKEAINIRLSRDVLAVFRASGPGWQTRMDSALRAWIKKHPPKAA